MYKYRIFVYDNENNSLKFDESKYLFIYNEHFNGIPIKNILNE